MTHLAAEHRREGCHRTSQPAGVDVLEESQIGIEIHSEAVHGHAAGDADTDRGNLARFSPDPRKPILRPPVDTQLGQRADERLLEPADVRNHLPGLGQAKNRIADQLAGTVKSDVPTPIHMKQLSAEFAQHSLINQQMGFVSVATDRVGGGMLEQQQIIISTTAISAALVKGALQIPRLAVWKPAQPANSHASSCSQSQVSRFCLSRCRKSTAVEPSKAR